MHFDLRTRRDIRWPLALLLSCALATAAQAAPSGDTVKPAKTKARAARAPKIDHGWTETASERERRLYRECQGRPNAGACAGYAR